MPLARGVRRVSLTSDQLGYDVTAPRIGGSARLLEIKTTTAALVGSTVAIHLSRGEARTGLRLPDGSLVVCAVENVDQCEARIIGWCEYDTIAGALPHDTPAGRWEHARLELEVARLLPGLPSAIA
jgi:hypothetical protein